MEKHFLSNCSPQYVALRAKDHRLNGKLMVYGKEKNVIIYVFSVEKQTSSIAALFSCKTRLEAPRVEIIIVRYWSAWVADSMLLMLPLFAVFCMLFACAWWMENFIFPNGKFSRGKTRRKRKSMEILERQEWEQIVKPNVAHLMFLSRP